MANYTMYYTGYNEQYHYNGVAITVDQLKT